MRTRVILQQTPITTATPTTISPSSHLRSPWHSPVPYLFGGLAAMLGLIAFALLILACSYWRLSSNYDDNRDEEEGKSGDGEFKVSPVFEEKVLVIMAGENMPTYMATPKFSKVALVVTEKEVEMGLEEEKEGTSGENAQDQMKTRDETQENRDREHQQEQHSSLTVDNQ